MMLGSYQSSHLRIEVNATQSKITESLTHPNQFRQWMWPQQFPADLPTALTADTVFTSWLGVIPIRHEIIEASATALCFRMSQGVEGFHHWHWGEGWVQSCIEGYSLLPLGVGQSASLLRLRYFLSR